MAQVVLTAVGGALGGPVGAAIGAGLGGLADRALVSALAPARQGPRLEGLRLNGVAEGAPMPAVFGRARVAGQIIWAARFKERATTSGGKGRPKTTEYGYALSFAVALGEGPVDGVGRVWADGKPLDMTEVAMRLHRGGAEQTPDALIEAVEGPSPAYRGTVYVVFEDLDLTPFGNRVPQLSFEVFRRARAPDAPPGLEEMLTGVCLIPGAGESVLATYPVQRREGLTRAVTENVNNPERRPDVLVALDQLQAQLPHVREVTVVVSWFGTDLRAGACEIRPGVEYADKQTIPVSWRVGGLERGDAHLISRLYDEDGEETGPAYGGTPSDRSVVELIRELKRRGLKVTLYPFILMDVPEQNDLPDPYGGGVQAKFPWRGRITCHPAPGQVDSPDGTDVAAEQVSAFFGQCQAADFQAEDYGVAYAGPEEWGLRRLVLHYALLGKLAGGVDGVLIGSELRGLTTVRSAGGHYPAAGLLRTLALDVKAVVGGGCAVSYAADWSEWSGHQPRGLEGDAAGDVRFPLDEVWACPAVDYVGIDFYPPLSDWRDGDAHLDAVAGAKDAYDPAYLAGQVRGGEGFDWFYASDADREVQVRTSITDGAHGEPWVYRSKDLHGWWSHAHHERRGGVRSATPTAWTPGMKPIRLVEFGCPAVDKGANSPNLFVDPKSSESGLPPFSDGSRDDLIQRRTLEAVLGVYGDVDTMPMSPLDGRPMLEGMSAWCWDARPFPDFPARGKVWADARNWTLGHWLTGRAGAMTLPELVRAIGARAGVEIDPGEAGGVVTGYVLDRPMRVRDALAPLCAAFGLEPGEHDGAATLRSRSGPPQLALNADDLAWPEDVAAPVRRSRAEVERPALSRVRYLDEAADYQTAVASARADGAEGPAIDLDAPLTARRGQAELIAARRLGQAEAAADGCTAQLTPLAALRLEVGDRLRLPGDDGRAWRVTALDLDVQAQATLASAEAELGGEAPADDWPAPPPVDTPAPPVLRLIDPPPLPGAETDDRPLVAVAGRPWRGAVVSAGPAADAMSVRAEAALPAVLGETLSALAPGAPHRLDRGPGLLLRLEGGGLESRSLAAVAAGANVLAVARPGGGWEVLQVLDAAMEGPEVWRVRRLLRGQWGTDDAAAVAAPAGSAVVLLDGPTVRAAMGAAERGLTLQWRATPPGGLDFTAPAQGFTWRGRALRPWSPAHLRGRRGTDGAVTVRWTRRARLDGDGWDLEPPLGETEERYALEVLAGGVPVRRAEVSTPAWTYPAAAQLADLGAAPASLEVRVAQLSAVAGEGVWARRTLWL